jgi:hypothetical protein
VRLVKRFLHRQAGMRHAFVLEAGIDGELGNLFAIVVMNASV